MNGGSTIVNKSTIIGIFGGIFAIIVWLYLTYINPYNNPTLAGPLPYPFFLLFIPACLAIFASLKNSQKWMFVVFLWSLPMSLFIISMPDIMWVYSIISAFYLISFLLIRFNNRKET